MSYRSGMSPSHFLVKAFSFTAHVRMVTDEGCLEHAEHIGGTDAITLLTPNPGCETGTSSRSLPILRAMAEGFHSG